MRKYVMLWLALGAMLAFEAYSLNLRPEWSLTGLSPEPGEPLSLGYGWAGFSLMLLTNLYVLRKRVPFMSKWGKLPGWLNFHIFCGLMGPTFILFHTNFKVRGLVAVSFWSMVVVFVSGVIGRYLYLQVSQQKSDLQRRLREHEQALCEIFTDAVSGSIQIASEALENAKRAALALAGGTAALVSGPDRRFTFARMLAASVQGDLRLLLRSPRLAAQLPAGSVATLRKFAVTARKVACFDGFQRAMGYWHSFHMPFAFCMYGIAVIHVVAAHIFRV